MSFTRGATKVGVFSVSAACSAARSQILEAELGARLFDRNKHSVALTETGRVFYSEVQRTLSSLDSAIKAALRASKGQTGSLSLGFGGSTAHTFTPRLLRRFRELFPGVELTLRSVPLSSQFEALNDRHIDIGFLILPVDDERLATKVLMRDPLNVALPSGHPLCKHKTLSLAALEPYDFVAFPRIGGLGFYRRVLELCAKAGFIPKIVQEMTPLDLALSGLHGGRGRRCYCAVSRTDDSALPMSSTDRFENDTPS